MKIIIPLFTLIVMVFGGAKHTQFMQKYCRYESGLVIDAAVKTSDGGYYIFYGDKYTRIRRFRRPPGLDVRADYGRLPGLFDEYFYYPVIDTYPSPISDFINITQFGTNLDAAFTLDNYTYLVIGENLFQFHNQKLVKGPISKKTVKFLNHSYRVKAIGAVRNFNNSVSIFVTIPYRFKQKHKLDILYTVLGNSSLLRHQQINEELNALMFFHETPRYAEGIAFTGSHFNFFSGYWKYSNEFSTYPVLQGLLYPNEVFIGCPQLFCYAADLDGIAMKQNRNGFVFRGQYVWVWTPGKYLKVMDARLISEAFRGLPLYIDDAFIDNQGNMFVFKDTKVWMRMKNTHQSKFKSMLIDQKFPGIPDYIDAVWMDKLCNSVDGCLYFFKAYEVTSYDLSTKQILNASFTDFPGLPPFLDTAFTDPITKISYLFKRSFYYTLERMSGYLSPELSQGPLFGCLNSFDYKKFGYPNYQAFAKRMSQFVPVTASPNVEKMHQIISKRRAKSSLMGTITKGIMLTSIIVGAIIVIVALVYWRYKK